MKKNNLTVPLSMTATLAFILTCSLSCSKNPPPPVLPPPVPEPPTTNAANPGSATAAVTNADTATPTNPVAANLTDSAGVSNPPPLAANSAPAPEPVPTLPVAPTTKVIEMPATVPVAPTNFYSDDAAKNQQCCAKFAGNPNYFFRFRAGYEHLSAHDSADSYYLSVKFYANGDALRQRVGQNGWLIPDADFEVVNHLLPKPENDPHPGSDQGTSLRADLFWPWLHYIPRSSRTNGFCPLCQPLALGLGPVAEFGFDRLNGSGNYHFAHYAGVRLPLNRYGFVEYTAGGTDGQSGTRQQVAAELPISTSRDGEVKYFLHGNWNSSYEGGHDIWAAGIFVELPFGTLTKPSKWGDFIPFKQ
jgi:hypothetical protein